MEHYFKQLPESREMKPQTIFLMGVTGKVGGAALESLASNFDGELVAGLRRPNQFIPRANVTARHFDLDRPDTFASSLSGVDAALLLTGYSVDMLAQSVAFLDAAKSQGVRRIVHIGASGAPTNEVAHWVWHRLVESYIEKLGFTFTHLQPEAYMQNITGPGYRWLESDTIKHYIGDAKWTWVDARDVGGAAAEALRHPARHAGKTYRLGADDKTMTEVAAILSQASARNVVAESHAPDEFLAGALNAGADPAYMRCVFRQFQLDAAGLIPPSGAVASTLENLLRRPPANWETFAQEWAARLAMEPNAPESRR